MVERPSYDHKLIPLYAASLDVVSDFGLQYYVTEPTSTAHGHTSVLHLLFCNKRDIVSAIKVIPDISDHKYVVANLKCCYDARDSVQPRKSFAFDRGNYTSFCSDLFEFLPEVRVVQKRHPCC